jgi:hypothetical protein
MTRERTKLASLAQYDVLQQGRKLKRHAQYRAPKGVMLTSISEPCGSTGITGDLSGCGRSCEQRAMRNEHQAG